LYLCFGETEVLNAAFGFVSYTWHDNSTDDYYIVTQSGIYTVTVEDINGCLGSDTVFAVMGDIVQLEDSLVLCKGETATIHAGSGFNFYSWNTGQTGTDSITVNEEGWYKVNVSYVFGCPSEDSTFVEALSVPEAEISGSDLLCEGDTLWLIAPEGKYEYYWNDEQGSDEYMVTSGGTYNLKMINACGEDEESKVVQLSPLPMVDLGEDKLLLPGESVTLDAGNFQAFIWNNDPGQTGQYYTIAYEDIQELDSIWVEVFDGFCKNSDDIIIEVFSVDVPNVITPNGDGFNDRFMPGEGWSGISNHTIMVFNRWGEKVWESSNFSSGWDGKNNGQLVSSGTYFWVLEVWYGKEDIKKVYKGSLTVLGDKD
jgi:gliding motility-associated-like protein